jgi:hypothetical protein
MERETVKTAGDYRAVIIRDEYGDAPDGDWQAAVIRLDYSGYYEADAKTEAAGDFEDAAKRFMEYYGMRKGMAVFQRYLTIFQGTNDYREFSYSYSPDSAVYVAFDTAELRKLWGCADDRTDGAEGTAAEWQAYIDGDVYGVALERRVTVASVTTFHGDTVATAEDEDWQEIDDTAVWGHYGESWATEAAIEALTDYLSRNDSTN